MFDLRTLNPQQREAVQTVRGPVLILAGAGTGKTRVITHRIAHMVRQGISAKQILGVTFTNKAAREMQERVRQLIRGGRSESSRAERPTVCTFHSLCVRILRRYIDRLGYKRNFVIYSQSDQLAAIKKVLSHFRIQGEMADPRKALALISCHRNGGQAGVNGSEDIPQAIGILHSKYQGTLKACNAVDFDDLILLTLKLFGEHPEVLAECREQFRYIMVDEYQDTNAAQFQLVHELAREHRNLCVVGDDDQSIYSWRGAVIENLLDLERYFPEVKVIKLEQNYRSTNTILAAANALIRNNSRRRIKKLWSQNGQGAPVALDQFADDVEEAKSLVERIEYHRQLKRIPWRDQAVLFRTNLQSRPIEIALRQSGVRYHLIGGQSFFDRREVKDFVAYLKVLLHPDDDVSLLRILNVPPRGLSEATVERLLAASQERNGSVYSVMVNPVVAATFTTRTRSSIEAFVDFVQRTRSPLVSSEVTSLSQWASQFLAEIDYPGDLKRSEKDPETRENRLRNLKELVAALDQVESTGHTPEERLLDFLEDLTLDTDRTEDKERTGDAVTLITIHSCKGLEFPYVSIVGVEEELIPHARSKVEGTLEEERRLFYVALTRAKQRLWLSHCRSRQKYGERVPCHPSRFLLELPSELVTNSSTEGAENVSAQEGKSFFDGLRSVIGAAGE